MDGVENRTCPSGLDRREFGSFCYSGWILPWAQENPGSQRPNHKWKAWPKTWATQPLGHIPGHLADMWCDQLVPNQSLALNVTEWPHSSVIAIPHPWYNCFFFFFLFYFWLLWVFITACGLSLVEGSRGYSLVVVRGLLMDVAFVTADQQALGCTGSVVVAHGLSCPKACGIFLVQRLNPCRLHWQVDSYY